MKKTTMTELLAKVAECDAAIKDAEKVIEAKKQEIRTRREECWSTKNSLFILTKAADAIHRHHKFLHLEGDTLVLECKDDPVSSSDADWYTLVAEEGLQWKPDQNCGLVRCLEAWGAKKLVYRVAVDPYARFACDITKPQETWRTQLEEWKRSEKDRWGSSHMGCSGFYPMIPGLLEWEFLDPIDVTK